MHNFKLNKFLINTMINHNLYLGYARSQLNTKMAFNLLGSRSKLDVHKLTSTYYSIRQAITLCNFIWTNFSIIWLVSPRNTFIGYLWKNLDLKKQKIIAKSLFLWLKVWLPGFFNNTLGFVKYKKKLIYPSALFYLAYTTNVDRVQEAKLRGILHFTIIDTNSPVFSNYFINSNETTESSNLYYSKLLLSSCLVQKKLSKKYFLI